MSTQRGNDRLITVTYSESTHLFLFLLSRAGNQLSLSNMAINRVGRKFENNL